MTASVWIPSEVALAIHDEQIAEHGGLAGLRDATLLDSALERPLPVAPDIDVCDLPRAP